MSDEREEILQHERLRMTATRLADHPDYRITLHQPENKCPDNKLVVTFDGQPSDLGDEGFGTSLCMKNGWTNIYVAQRHGTQYQGLSVSDFFDIVSPYCNGKDVVVYGSSLGAYAAFYFGGCINGRIIGAAPMFPAWYKLNNNTYADLKITHTELYETPLSSNSPVVIYDPNFERDKFVVDEMIGKAYGNTRHVEVPYGGHTVLLTLNQARLTGPIITGLIERDEIIDFTPPGEGTAAWHAQVGGSLMLSDPEAAMRHLETSLAIKPATQPYCRILNLLFKRGDMAAVQARIDEANASGEPQLKIVKSLADKLRGAGIRVD